MTSVTITEILRHGAEPQSGPRREGERREDVREGVDEGELVQAATESRGEDGIPATRAHARASPPARLPLPDSLLDHVDSTPRWHAFGLSVNLTCSSSLPELPALACPRALAAQRTT